MDGTGYPNGLKGHEVGLFSKIVSVADVFDAITSKRIYKAKQSPEIALTEMVKEQYNKYDPLILEALFRTQNKSLLQSIQ
jgi:putative two-component system response regulator